MAECGCTGKMEVFWFLLQTQEINSAVVDDLLLPLRVVALNYSLWSFPCCWLPHHHCLLGSGEQPCLLTTWEMKAVLTVEMIDHLTEHLLCTRHDHKHITYFTSPWPVSDDLGPACSSFGLYQYYIQYSLLGLP